MTKHSTYENTGTMQDYMRFLTEGLKGDSALHTSYRCYCKILHEYQDFAWVDRGETPHLIKECDGFVEYDKETSEPHEPPYISKPMTHAADNKQQPSMKS